MSTNEPAAMTALRAAPGTSRRNNAWAGILAILCTVACGGTGGNSGAPLLGEDGGVLFENQPGPTSIAVDGDALFWNNCGFTCRTIKPGVGIVRAGRDGSEKKQLIDTPMISDVFVAGEKIYYRNLVEELYVLSKDGGDATEVAQHVYSTSAGFGSVYTIERGALRCTDAKLVMFDGSGEKRTLADAPCEAQLAVGKGLVFAVEHARDKESETSTSALSRFSEQSGEWTRVAEIEGWVSDMEVVGDTLYFVRSSSDYSDKTIERLSSTGELTTLEQGSGILRSNGSELMMMRNPSIEPPSLFVLADGEFNKVAELPEEVSFVHDFAIADRSIYWVGTSAIGLDNGVVGVTHF